MFRHCIANELYKRIYLGARHLTLVCRKCLTRIRDMNQTMAYGKHGLSVHGTVGAATTRGQVRFLQMMKKKEKHLMKMPSAKAQNPERT